MEGDFQEREWRPRPSGPQLLAQVRVLAMICVSMAAWVGKSIADARPGFEKCMILAFIPAALIILSVGLFVFAHESGRGGADGGSGPGGGGPDDPWGGPGGGVEFDWDEFEREFREYAARQYVGV